MLRELDTTVTFKMVKVDLRKQAYDLAQAGVDLILVMKPRAKHYEPLDADFLAEIKAGRGGY